MKKNNQNFVFSEIKRKLSFFLVFLIVVCVYLFIKFPDDKFHIHFFDIGQGDSIFIKTPENHQILIDTGPDNLVVERLLESMNFFDKSIDLLLISHADLDHIGGVLDVLKRYSVEYILINGVAGSSPVYQKFLDELEVLNQSEKTKIIFPEAGDIIKLGNVSIEVLYPFGSLLAEKGHNVNDSSIVLQVEYAGKKILLAGDISEDIEKQLIKKYGSRLRSHIFKAIHHGSKSSNSLAFLQIVSPEIVVIQAGKDNRFNHPHVEVLMNFYRVNVKEILEMTLIGLSSLLGKNTLFW
jgi:competence protein ComEC